MNDKSQTCCWNPSLMHHHVPTLLLWPTRPRRPSSSLMDNVCSFRDCSQLKSRKIDNLTTQIVLGPRRIPTSKSNDKQAPTRARGGAACILLHMVMPHGGERGCGSHSPRVRSHDHVKSCGEAETGQPDPWSSKAGSMEWSAAGV